MIKSSLSIWRLLSKCQIDGEDFFNFCVLLRKHELYLFSYEIQNSEQELGFIQQFGITRDLKFQSFLSYRPNAKTRSSYFRPCTSFVTQKNVIDPCVKRTASATLQHNGCVIVLTLYCDKSKQISWRLFLAAVYHFRLTKGFQKTCNYSALWWYFTLLRLCLALLFFISIALNCH